MELISDETIKKILRTDSNNIVLQEESEEIEFKRIYDTGSKEAKAKYTKSLAALCNHKGGYLIFGIDNNSNELLGLTDFVQPDNADITNDINTYFSPAISYHSKKVEINNKSVFVIYVEKRKNIPVVSIKGHQTELIEGIIYRRYNAQSSPIKPGDLINLLHELRGAVNEEVNSIMIADTKAKWKPKFEIGSMTTPHNSIKIILTNTGESAIVKNIQLLEGNFYPITNSVGYEIANKSRFHVEMRHKGNGIIRNELFKIKFEWEDKIGTKYSGTINGNRGSVNLIIE